MCTGSRNVFKIYTQEKRSNLWFPCQLSTSLQRIQNKFSFIYAHITLTRGYEKIDGLLKAVYLRQLVSPGTWKQMANDEMNEESGLLHQDCITVYMIT